MWVITSRDHIRAGVVLLVLNLLLLILKLLDTGLPRLGTRSARFPVHGGRIRIPRVAILPLHASRVPRAAPVEYALADAGELRLTVRGWVLVVRVAAGGVVFIYLTRELLLPQFSHFLIIVCNFIAELAIFCA